jgi:hypothetical protein
MISAAVDIEVNRNNAVALFIELVHSTICG